MALRVVLLRDFALDLCGSPQNGGAAPLLAGFVAVSNHGQTDSHRRVIERFPLVVLCQATVLGRNGLPSVVFGFSRRHLVPPVGRVPAVARRG
jgi:hypothetical protein